MATKTENIAIQLVWRQEKVLGSEKWMFPTVEKNETAVGLSPNVFVIDVTPCQPCPPGIHYNPATSGTWTSVSLSLTETLDSAPKMLYFSKKAPQSLWQESVGTPTFILSFVLSDMSLCPFV